MNNFLSEYVFEKDRDNVIDFKTNIALRGDIALCQYESKHRADELVELAKFLLNVPENLFEYSVSIAKEYFDAKDVEKLAEHILSETPLIYLYTDKVLSDINEVMKQPTDTKKSIFCRYIEDTNNLVLAKELLIATLKNTHCYYLHDIAQLYLTNVNEILKEHLENGICCSPDFYTVWDTIILKPIYKSPTLTAEKCTNPKKHMDLSNYINTTPEEDDFEENVEVYNIQTEADIDKILKDLQTSLNQTTDMLNETTESISELANQIYDLYDDSGEY